MDGQGAEETDESDGTILTTQSDIWPFGMTVLCVLIFKYKYVCNALKTESHALQELLSRNVPYHTLKIEAQVIFAVNSERFLTFRSKAMVRSGG